MERYLFWLQVLSVLLTSQKQQGIRQQDTSHHFSEASHETKYIFLLFIIFKLFDN